MIYMLSKTQVKGYKTIVIRTLPGYEITNNLYAMVQKELEGDKSDGK